MSGFKDRHLLLTVMEAVKFKIRVPAWWDFGENSLFGLKMGSILLHPHDWGEGAQVFPLLLRALISS